MNTLQITLSREGFDVHVATDGVAALDNSGRMTPDLVLLDVMLPPALRDRRLP